MKQTRILLLFFSLWVLHVSAFAQTGEVFTKVEGLRSVQSFEPVNVFTNSISGDGTGIITRHLQDYSVVEVDKDVLRDIADRRPELVQLSLPGQERELIVDAYRVSPFSPGYSLRSSGRSAETSKEMLFYHGAIRGMSGSLCAISIIDGEIKVMYTGKMGTWRIHRLNDVGYISFKDGDRLYPTLGECAVDKLDLSGSNDTSTESKVVGNCVEVYFETDYESFQDNGSSLANTEAWVADLFSEVMILYANESIPVAISEIFVWEETDPYASLGSTSAVLNEFVDQTSSGYNGRLAHFISTRGLGGGIAYVDVLCSNTLACAVSASLSTNITEFPEYSWNVSVVSHEMGHNFGSRHTHRCTWNGNNTQIDDCGNVWANNNGSTPEGNSCFDEHDPILPGSEGGTIMSYCHLMNGVGINFSNGFGTQPGNLMRNRYNGASCSTGSCVAPGCVAMSIPADGAINVSVDMDITWPSSIGAIGYYIRIGTSPGGSEIQSLIDIGDVTTYDPGTLPFDTEIYVQILPYNTFGDAVDCVEASFTTEANVPPLCTQLSYPGDGVSGVPVSVTLSWQEADGYELGYNVRLGTTPGGGEILNNVDVGLVTTYFVADLPTESLIYARVTPYGSAGPTSGCENTTFTTSAGQGGDNCAEAVTVSCGTTISGSTIGATYSNPGSCGTSVSAAGVWYKFIGQGGTVVLSMCNAADYDTKVNVYTGSCGNLTCVTGNDDKPGCNYASEVTFTALNDQQYFILVNGWNGQTGNFNMAMACSNEDYCPSQGILSENEWISGVSLDGVEHTSGSAGYSDFRDVTFLMAPGSSSSVEITPGFSGESNNQYIRLWVDLDANAQFESDELLIDEIVTGASLVSTLSIPAIQEPGDYVMRLSMKRNVTPSSCDVFTYGEVEEYTLRIRCEVVSTVEDNAVGSLRGAVDCAGDGDTIFFASELVGLNIVLSGVPLLIDKSIVIDANGQDIIVSSIGLERTIVIGGQANAELVGLTVRSGSSSNGACIQNDATLKITDVSLKRSQPSAIELLRNNGVLLVEGNCDILDQ